MESGDLDYYQIRKIENKEIMNLSKKKSEAGCMKLAENEQLKKLNGKGKPMDKNLNLLKEILKFIEIDLSQESAENLLEVPDNESELKSISFKNINVGKPDKEFLQKHLLKNRESSSVSNKITLKRVKNNEIDSFHEELKFKIENEDDVNFIEIPTMSKSKG